MIANLVQVQEMLGDRVGRDIFFYSITLDPERDTPAVLKEYAARFGVKPGWEFLTCGRDDMEHLRRILGFVDVLPEIDADRSEHIGVIRFGNESLDRWAATPALSDPDHIVRALLWMEGRKRNDEGRRSNDERMTKDE